MVAIGSGGGSESGPASVGEQESMLRLGSQQWFLRAPLKQELDVSPPTPLALCPPPDRRATVDRVNLWRPWDNDWYCYLFPFTYEEPEVQNLCHIAPELQAGTLGLLAMSDFCP